MSYISDDISTFLKLLSQINGIGPRSAKRIAFDLLKKKETVLNPLAQCMLSVSQKIRPCSQCCYLDTIDPCTICQDTARNTRIICVVEESHDVWTMEKTGVYDGVYHVLDGMLKALDGIGHDDLNINNLIDRIHKSYLLFNNIEEVILALSTTVEGQTTTYYIANLLQEKIQEWMKGNTFFSAFSTKICTLAQGMPVGGSLDYLDQATITSALKMRQLL